MDRNQKRKAIAGLFISAAAVVGVMNREGFTDHAVIPIPGDVPTYGYGSTVKADGSKVKINDTISRSVARTLLNTTIDKTYSDGIKTCAGDLELYQHEFDFLVDSAYNLGVKRICTSSIISKFRSGDYAGGCAVILQYKYAAGKDCTKPQNKCGGIPKDRERAYKLCMWGDYGISSSQATRAKTESLQE